LVLELAMAETHKGESGTLTPEQQQIVDMMDLDLKNPEDYKTFIGVLESQGLGKPLKPGDITPGVSSVAKLAKDKQLPHSNITPSSDWKKGG
jgi:hypothetical protein